MTNEKLQDALNLIDDELINEVNSLRNKKPIRKRRIIRTVLVAAVLTTLLVATFSFISQIGRDNQNDEKMEAENVQNEATLESLQNSVAEEAYPSKEDELWDAESSVELDEELVSEELIAPGDGPSHHKSKYTVTVKVDEINSLYFLGTVTDNSQCKILQLGETVKVFAPKIDESTEYVIIKFTYLSNGEITIIYSESIIVE